MTDIYVTGTDSQATQIQALRQRDGFTGQMPNSNAEEPTEPALHLYWDDAGLALRDTQKRFGDIRIDFDAGKSKHRSQFGGAEALPKACGMKGNTPLKIIDCTCGYGQDSWVLARRGAIVTAAERTPALYAMLNDALQRTTAAAAANITLHMADAATVLASQSFDVAYLDPMFPPRQKSAAVKKEMQALHLLVGHQPFDAAALLATARQSVPRVVVKRPKTAEPLATPDQIYTAGAIRFDLYLAS